ncbi:hypothetical protein BH23BAC1_BH23BAC1_17470 [soil metagenome]
MVPYQNLIIIKQVNGLKLYRILVFILFILQIPSTLLARGFEFKPGKEISIINFKYIDGLIILPFKIEKKEVNLVLDTGIPNIILFEKFGSYGLKPETNKEILFSGIGTGNLIKGKRVTEVNAEAENIIGSGLALLIIPQNNLSKNFKMKINGLIGYDLFSRFLVTIDYVKRQLILTNPKSFKALDFYLQKELILVDTKPYLKFNMNIPGVEEKEYSFFLDTGAGYDLMLLDNPYPEDKKKKYHHLGNGLSGNILGRLHLVDEIYFDDFYFNKFFVSVPFTSTYMDNDLMKGRDGTLGGKFLHKFDKVVIDYSNKKIYFQNGPLLAKKLK